MKKILLVFVFSFAILQITFCAPFKVLSFNLNGSERNHRYEINEQWAEDIVACLKQSEADIILLQEVSIELEAISSTKLFKKPQTNNVLDYFVRQLSGSNGEWGYFTSAGYMLRKNTEVNGITYKSGNKTQNNAILYNKSKFSAIDKAQVLGFKDFSGKYKFDKNATQFVEFTELDTGRIINVINVHLPWNDYDSYIRDLATLESLYANSKLTSAVLVGGDFNTPRQSLNSRAFDVVDGEDSWYYDRSFGLLTTVSKNNTDSFEFNNAFDHFICSRKIMIRTKMTRVNVLTNAKFFNSVRIGNNTFYNTKEYFDRISDHYPIIIEIEII